MDDLTLKLRRDHARPALPTPGPEAGSVPRWRPSMWCAAALALVYVLPAASPQDTGLSMVALLLINPLVTFVAAAILGLVSGFAWRLLPLAGLAWAAAALIVYNDSALPYGVGYFVFAVAGLGFGAGLRGLTRPRATSARPPARSSDDVDAFD